MGGITDRKRQEIVWVTQISGDRYLCLECTHHARDGATPRALVYANYLVAIYVDKTWVAYDRSWLRDALDLTALGTVIDLR